MRNERFTSYVALEFEDTEKENKFTTGIVFDCYRDQSFDYKWFVLHKQGFPDNLFVDEATNVPYDIPGLKIYLKRTIGRKKSNLYEFYETNKRYQEVTLGKFGQMENKYRTLLRKAVPFSPIADIEKYEKSRAFTTGIFAKRIALTAIQESWIQERMERPDEKRLFLNSLDDLKRDGLIDYSWEKYEEGNLVEKICLIPDEKAIRVCYGRLGCTPAKEKADELFKRIGEYLQELNSESPLSHFLKISMEELEKRRRIQGFFTEDQKLNEDIIKCLIYMEQNQEAKRIIFGM